MARKYYVGRERGEPSTAFSARSGLGDLAGSAAPVAKAREDFEPLAVIFGLRALKDALTRAVGTLSRKRLHDPPTVCPGLPQLRSGLGRLS